MGVSTNSGTPKWMVKIMENPIKMDDLGVPLFLETPTWNPQTEVWKMIFLFNWGDSFERTVCEGPGPVL